MLAAAERARKQAETERDELSEELASNSSGKWVLSHTQVLFKRDASLCYRTEGRFGIFV